MMKMRPGSKQTTYLSFLWCHTGHWRGRASFCGSLKHVSCDGKRKTERRGMWTTNRSRTLCSIRHKHWHPSTIDHADTEQVSAEQAGLRWSTRAVEAFDWKQAWAHSCLIHLNSLTSVKKEKRRNRGDWRHNHAETFWTGLCPHATELGPNHQHYSLRPCSLLQYKLTVWHQARDTFCGLTEAERFHSLPADTSSEICQFMPRLCCF